MPVPLALVAMAIDAAALCGVGGDTTHFGRVNLSLLWPLTWALPTAVAAPLATAIAGEATFLVTRFYL